MARPRWVPEYPVTLGQDQSWPDRAHEHRLGRARHASLIAQALPDQIFSSGDLDDWLAAWHQLKAAGRDAEAQALAETIDNLAYVFLPPGQRGRALQEDMERWAAEDAGQPTVPQWGDWRPRGRHFRGLATQQAYRDSAAQADPQGDVARLAQAAYRDQDEDPLAFHALADRHEELGQMTQARAARNLAPHQAMSRRGLRKKMSGVNAPAGGVLVRGQFYAGGKFIPSAEVEKAGHAEWRHVQEARQKKYSRADGSVDTEALLAGQKRPSPAQEERAKVLEEARALGQEAQNRLRNRERNRPRKNSRQSMSDTVPPPPVQQSLTLGSRQAARPPAATPAKLSPPQTGARLRKLLDVSRAGPGSRDGPGWWHSIGAMGVGSNAPEVAGMVQAAESGDLAALQGLLDWYEEEVVPSLNEYGQRHYAELRADLNDLLPWLTTDLPEDPVPPSRAHTPRPTARW